MSQFFEAFLESQIENTDDDEFDFDLTDEDLDELFTEEDEMEEEEESGLDELFGDEDEDENLTLEDIFGAPFPEDEDMLCGGEEIECAPFWSHEEDSPFHNLFTDIDSIPVRSAPDITPDMSRDIDRAVQKFRDEELEEDIVAICLALMLSYSYYDDEDYADYDIWLRARMLLGADRSDDIMEAIHSLRNLMDKIEEIVSEECRHWTYHFYSLLFGSPSINPHFDCFNITV